MNAPYLKKDISLKMNNKGFTLVELIVSMAVGLVVMGAIYAATEMGQRSSVAVERKIVAQQDARAALDIMALEIGMASFNPNFATGIWVYGPNTGTCGSTSGYQAYKGIQEATAHSITVEMDIHGDTLLSCSSPHGPPDGDIAVDCHDPNEIIRYHYDAVNKYITRETNCGGGQAFLGDQTGNPRDVQVVNPVSVPLFTYYDGQDVQIPYANLPASIPDIRRIRITLFVDTEAIDRSLNRRRRTISSTSIIPRNHALN